MNAKEFGYQIADGLFSFVGKWLLIGWLALCAINFVLNWLNIGTDDSDFNGRNRSGMTVLKDAKMGIEYLSDGKGGLVRRENE